MASPQEPETSPKKTPNKMQQTVTLDAFTPASPSYLHLLNLRMNLSREPEPENEAGDAVKHRVSHQTHEHSVGCDQRCSGVKSLGRCTEIPRLAAAAEEKKNFFPPTTEQTAEFPQRVLTPQ